MNKNCEYKKGDRVGEWTILKKSDTKKYSYTCQCSCGNIRDVYKSGLKRGKSRSCGCIKPMANRSYSYRRTDKKILGKKFGLLTPKKRINKQKQATYLCDCDCGNEFVAEARHLLGGQVVSCGCKKKKEIEELSKKYFHLARERVKELSVEGTQLHSLSKKTHKNSKSGIKGVSLLSSGKYRVDIQLSGKRKYLGTFSSFKEAKEVRKKAEEKYYKPLLEKYSDIIEKED